MRDLHGNKVLKPEFEGLVRAIGENDSQVGQFTEADWARIKIGQPIRHAAYVKAAKRLIKKGR